MERPLLRTFIAYVEDRPGVLNRVASLFRRRSYNIESLTVGRTHLPGVSRLTVVMEADEDGARRIEANIYKLVNVLWVKDITHDSAVERDLALIKVRANADNRAQILQLLEVYRARAVDVSPETIIIEMAGAAEKVDSLIEVLRPFGILEAVRSGMIAMTRGADVPDLMRSAPPAASQDAA
jgi:acetolactate synthase-1/3 small subunit